MRRRAALSLAGFVCSVIPLFGQNATSPKNLYERVICVVPMVGSGTYEDPRRPMFVPTEADWLRTEGQPQIIAYAYELSDDGQYALVEFVARDRKALEAIVGSERSDVKAFRKGKAKRQDVEREFGKHKKNVDWEKFWSRFGVIAR
jgi:hypothetical protein